VADIAASFLKGKSKFAPKAQLCSGLAKTSFDKWAKFVFDGLVKGGFITAAREARLLFTNVAKCGINNVVDMLEQMLTNLAGQGILGLLLVLAIIGLYQKDRRCAMLQDKRVEDFRAVKSEYVKFITELNSTLDKLCSLIEQKFK